MRPVPNLRIEQYRRRHPTLGDSAAWDNWGYFEVPSIRGFLRIIASCGSEENEKGWEHVSVSCSWNRLPTWDEMKLVKELFWNDEETVVQFHQAKSQYRNFHPSVLHLWRLRGHDFALPPGELIAPETSPYGCDIDPQTGNFTIR